MILILILFKLVKHTGINIHTSYVTAILLPIPTYIKSEAVDLNIYISNTIENVSSIHKEGFERDLTRSIYHSKLFLAVEISSCVFFMKLFLSAHAFFPMGLTFMNEVT